MYLYAKNYYEKKLFNFKLSQKTCPCHIHIDVHYRENQFRKSVPISRLSLFVLYIQCAYSKVPL